MSMAAARDPYGDFLQENPQLEHAANLIIEGIREFANLATPEQFQAAAQTFHTAEEQTRPTSLRGIIEGKLFSRQIDRTALRRFSLAARATEVALGHSPWHHQIVAALLLSRGTIVQMPNGAGKTLAIALVACYRALEGNSTHIVTSNDYLAERDCRWMGPIYHLLGFSAGVVFTAQTPQFRFGILEPNLEPNLETNSVTLRVAPEQAETLAQPAEPVLDHNHDQEVEDNPAVSSQPEDEGSSIDQEPDQNDGPSTDSREMVEDASEEPDSQSLATAADGAPSPSAAPQLTAAEPESSLIHASHDACKVDPGLTLKEVMACDVVYGRMETFGFAYLQDNRAKFLDAQVLNRRDTLIVDECDSAMLDDLRTDLTLTDSDSNDGLRLEPDDFATTYQIARMLRPGIDFTQEGTEITYTYAGVDQLRAITQRDLFTPEVGRYAVGVLSALKALYCYRRDEDYIVYEGKIVIIEGKSGRLLFGRRYRTPGLHESLEYKEGLAIHAQENQPVLGKITIKNFVRTYAVVSGTSGSIGTEQEYAQFYGLDTIKIEPYRDTRLDRPDLVYRTKPEAIEYGVISQAVEASQAKRPVLINVPTQRDIASIADQLRGKGVPTQILDVNSVRSLGEEAEKVRRAGSSGLITVCSKLAARGTDIILTDEARQAGGLLVIGLERTMNRRYDDQLLGRAARHGDPGEAVFVLSLQDELMRTFAQEWVSNLLEHLGMDEGTSIESKFITKRIRVVQGSVLRSEQTGRISAVELDDIVDRHRARFYIVRQKILEKGDVSEEIKAILENWIYLWELADAKKSPGDKDDSHYAPFRNYLARPELERVMNVRAAKPRARVLRDVVERELAPILASVSVDPVFKRFFLDVMDKRWQGYLVHEQSARDDLNLYPWGGPGPIARYAESMEEHFDTFFVDVGVNVLAGLLHHRKEQLNYASGATQ
jgi:preprotein translocase subunit SecA